jgi:hypothetical protein
MGSTTVTSLAPILTILLCLTLRVAGGSFGIGSLPLLPTISNSATVFSSIPSLLRILPLTSLGPTFFHFSILLFAFSGHCLSPILLPTRLAALLVSLSPPGLLSLPSASHEAFFLLFYPLLLLLGPVGPALLDPSLNFFCSTAVCPAALLLSAAAAAAAAAVCRCLLLLSAAAVCCCCLLLLCVYLLSAAAAAVCCCYCLLLLSAAAVCCCCLLLLCVYLLLLLPAAVCYSAAAL